MIQKEDGLLNWTNSACSLCRQVRALQPWPGTYTYAQNSLLYIKKACVYEADMPLRQNNVQSSAKTQNGAKEKKLEPGTVVGIDKNIGILVQTGDGILAVQELQRQSKKSLMWKDFLNGCRTFIGCRCTEAQNN